jgi:hypothetical protein
MLESLVFSGVLDNSQDISMADTGSSHPMSVRDAHATSRAKISTGNPVTLAMWESFSGIPRLFPNVPLMWHPAAIEHKAHHAP